MPRNFVAIVTRCAVLTALLAILGPYFSQPRLHVTFTPVTTALILSIAFYNWRAAQDSYSLWIAIGLFFSLLGDVALLWPDRYFLCGLGFFLLAHIAYLMAFSRDAKFPARPLVWLASLAVAGGSSAFLYPDLPIRLRLPVTVYAAVLASMVAQALGRSMVVRTTLARRAALGACLFMLSDLLLSMDRFHGAIPLAPVLVLAPYFAGQLLIARSTDISPSLTPARIPPILS